MSSSSPKNTININLVSTNFSSSVTQQQPSMYQQSSMYQNQSIYEECNNKKKKNLPYKMLPFCLSKKKLSPSHPLWRQLRGLTLFEQTSLIEQKLEEKIKSLDPTINDQASEIVKMIMNGQRQQSVLALFEDDMGLMHKMNEATAVLSQTRCNSVSPQPPYSSNKKIIVPSNIISPKSNTFYNNISFQSQPNIASSSPKQSVSPSLNYIKFPSQSNIEENKEHENKDNESKENDGCIYNDYKTKYDELRVKYHWLQTENEGLKREIKYSKWKWHDIYKWIMNINNKQFIAYDRILYHSLKAHCIDGSILRDLTVADWELLGITNQEKVMQLMGQIQSLFMPTTQTNLSYIEQIKEHEIVINGLKQRLQIMESQSIQQQHILKIALNQKVMELNKYIASNKELSHCYTQLIKEKNELELKYCLLDSKCIEMEKKLNKINCNDDKKENELNDNYLKWDYSNVYEWIISIENGYFGKKYKRNEIYNNLKSENIDGLCLNNIDKGDIHRMGITQFRDKLLLKQHIDKLISI